MLTLKNLEIEKTSDIIGRIKEQLKKSGQPSHSYPKNVIFVDNNTAYPGALRGLANQQSIQQNQIYRMENGKRRV